MRPADIDQRRTDENRGRDNERRDCGSLMCAYTSIKMSISSTTSERVFFHIPACVYYAYYNIVIILYSRIPEKFHHPY